MKRKFGRVRNQRQALLRSLAVALISRGKIKTTLARAKATRSFVERLITYAKNKPAAGAYREITKFINKGAARKLIRDVAPKYSARSGGYTRIVKIGRRGGDAAQIAFIELVD